MKICFKKSYHLLTLLDLLKYDHLSIYDTQRQLTVKLLPAVRLYSLRFTSTVFLPFVFFTNFHPFRFWVCGNSISIKIVSSLYWLEIDMQMKGRRPDKQIVRRKKIYFSPTAPRPHSSAAVTSGCSDGLFSCIKVSSSCTQGFGCCRHNLKTAVRTFKLVILYKDKWSDRLTDRQTDYQTFDLAPDVVFSMTTFPPEWSRLAKPRAPLDDLWTVRDPVDSLRPRDEEKDGGERGRWKKNVNIWNDIICNFFFCEVETAYPCMSKNFWS